MSSEKQRAVAPSSTITPTKSRPLPSSDSSLIVSSSSLASTPLSPKNSQPLTKLFKSAKHKSANRVGTSPTKSIVRKAPAQDVVAKDWTSTGTSPPKGKKIQSHYDRFIPNREAMNLPSNQFNIARREPPKDQYIDSADLAYQEEVAQACNIALDKRILSFNAKPPSNDKEDLRANYNRPLKKSTSTAFRRRILTSPERVLDAPGLADDYYLNLLDWSASNIVAIGLDKNVYLWNADTGEVDALCYLGADSIASLAWTDDGSFLSIGTAEGDTQIWDVETQTKLRSMTGHQARVGVLSWEKNVLSSGCRDGSIWHHDVRIAEHKVAELLGHTGEVCGLKWRPDGTQLASGGNDNLVNIWDSRSSVPKFTKTNHMAAVKAIAWCPWQANILATGGGAYDRHIHFWNTTTAARINSVDTGSQVTSIVWSKEYKEFVTSHGLPDNHLGIWSYPSLAKIIDIPAHESRVLHTAPSPDGQVVASAAADENLKFWRLFESRGKGKGKAGSGTGAGGTAAAGGTGGKQSRALKSTQIR